MAFATRPAMVFAALLMSWTDAVQAQTPGIVELWNPCLIGVSAGVWDRVPTHSETGRHNGASTDVSLECRLGSATHDGAPAIRVQIGKGAGQGVREPGFDYTRLLIGVVRKLTGASRAPFTVYVSAGGGAYELTSLGERRTKPSVYGAIGLDVALGSSPASIGAEEQVHTIGSVVYGTASVFARIHFR
jgi:hypothetical protein